MHTRTPSSCTHAQSCHAMHTRTPSSCTHPQSCHAMHTRTPSSCTHAQSCHAMHTRTPSSCTHAQSCHARHTCTDHASQPTVLGLHSLDCINRWTECGIHTMQCQATCIVALVLSPKAPPTQHPSSPSWAHRARKQAWHVTATEIRKEYRCNISTPLQAHLAPFCLSRQAQRHSPLTCCTSKDDTHAASIFPPAETATGKPEYILYISLYSELKARHILLFLSCLSSLWEHAALPRLSQLPVPASTVMASSAMAKGSGLENLTADFMLQSKGGSLEEGRAAGCESAAFCCSCRAAAAALLKWSEASSACRLKPLLNSRSICTPYWQVNVKSLIKFTVKHSHK